MGFNNLSEFENVNPAVGWCSVFWPAKSGRYILTFNQHSRQFLTEIGRTAIKFNRIELSEVNIKVFLFNRIVEHGFRRIIPIFRAID